MKKAELVKRNSSSMISPTQETLMEQSPVEAPPVFLRKLKRAAVAAGCDVRLRVSVGGNPRPTLHWYHNDDPLINDHEDYDGLWIRDCKQADGGLYTCVAVNHLGEARTSAVLAVLDLGEDSNSTEDESAEPQVSMEMKEHFMPPQGEAINSQPTGRGRAVLSYIPGDGPVVEREIQNLGSRAPGLQDPLSPSRDQLDFIKKETSPFVETQPFQNAQGPITLSDVEPTTDPTAAYNGTKTAINGAELPVKITSSAQFQSSGSQDKSSFQTPKASQASSKILDKVRAFEEQRHSSNIPKLSSSRLSWGFNRTSSCNSEDSRSKSGKLQDNSKSDVALKRSFFKQKASSLEEQSTYVQKHFQSKLSEELHRIKKLVGKSNIKKAFSMDQLTQTDKQSTGNTDSVPAQVIQKVEETTNSKDLLESRERWSALPKEESQQLQKKKLADESKQPERKSPPDITENQWRKHSKPRWLFDRQVISEKVTFSKIPGQCSPMVPRTNMSSKLPKSPAEIPPTQPIKQGGLVQAPQKPPRLYGSISVLPKSFKEREEKKDSSLIPKMTIPTIVAENKPVDEETHKAEKGQKEVNKHEGKIARRNRDVEGPMEIFGNYMSVEEDPAEAPMSEPALKNAVVAAGSVMMLQKGGKLVPRAPAESSLTITRPMQDVKVKAGETALFECFITGPHTVDVDWLTNGKLIQPALFDCKMQFDGHRCRLLFKSAHEDDSGSYSCKISSAKEELICTANLLVIPSKEPLFTRKLEALEATEGRSAQFDCKVSGSPPPEVNWTHCEQPVVESDNIRIVKVNGRHSLFITHINKESEGLYTVFARNVHGEAESSAELYVQEPRPAISTHMSRLEKMPSIPEEPEVFEGEVEHRTIPDFIKPLSDLEVVEGKEAVLKCRVTGLPYPKIIWYHNGTKIESSDDRKMIQYRDVHSLVINSVCHGHSGVYKCVISNNVGKAVCYAHLYVAVSLPEPPDGPPVIESVTGRTVSLSWKIPKNLNPPIDPASLMYIVQQQALGSTQWTTIASSLKDTSYTVTSLSKGVCYSFRVLNTTGKASSKPSQPTDLVQLCDRGQYLHKAPVILDKPDIVYVVENQPVTITITLNHVRATGTWKRRGVMLLNKPGALEMTMPDDDQHALHIAKVKSTDVGQLIFMANNQYGSDLCTLQLAMAVPPSFETIMEDLDVCVGETSRFAVVVDGKPDPDILWYKDNVLLAESSHFTFVYDDRECSLVVLNAQPEDEGVYTCTAKNQAGSVSCKAELTVHTAKNVEEKEEQMEDEGTILWRMRRLTDYYDIHKEIGRGAFSYIKRVTQPNGQTFAAKFISLRAKRKACALREMTLLSELDHEKIIHFYDAFEKRRVVVIITELCHEELLERITKRTTILESEVQSIIRQLLEGIDYLHQNDIIHLDIKPENILMADQKSDHIRICDFGNALKVEPNEELYCKYGTPEFIAPEIINQSPISKSTDIWPVGVITYLCLTGVSPFAGENDRDTLLNIRSYNVAFEERMFKDLCREAKGFIIKLLVASKLRPDATECLLHPWFKSLVKGKSINTTLHKQVLARRKWQCSLIRYKSKMVMRSISELLDDSSSHVSLAVPRNLKEGSPPPSSSSDSDEDIDELPFIPMPQTMMFSESRMSLTEIHEDDVDVIRGSNESYQENMNRLEDITECQTTDGQRDVDHLEIAERTVNLKDSFQRGSSVEAEQVAGKSRRALMRRGSSADSALLLQITPEDDNMNNTTEEVQKHMQKAVSMELPHSSNSPKTGRLSKEDYALKLDLMRQRLLKRGTVDKNMSGLRGPLLESLGVDNERRTASLDRNFTRAKLSASEVPRAFSSNCPEDTCPNTAFRKRSSLSDRNSESISLHRRSGAPLEIPSIFSGDHNLLDATSPLSEQTKDGPKPVFPREISSKPPTPDIENKQASKEEAIGAIQSMNTSQPASILDDNDKKVEKMEGHMFSEDCVPGKINKSTESSLDILPHDISSNYSSKLQVNGKKASSVAVLPTPMLKISEPDIQPTTGHPVVYASASSAYHPTLRTDIKDIDSEEIFEARFKKRESSLTHGLKRLTRTKSEENSPVLPRKSNEEVYRPRPVGAPLEFRPRGLKEKSKSVQDLREVEKEPRLGVIGRFSMRAKKLQSKKGKEETSDSEANRQHVTGAMGRSKSLDKKEVEIGSSDNTMDTEKENLEKNTKKVAESPVLAVRRKFESNVSGIFDRVHSKSKDIKDRETKPHSGEETLKEESQDIKKISDSPVLALRKKFESKVSGFSFRKQSQSDKSEGEKEVKNEEQKTPLFSRHRRSQSDGLIHKSVNNPENQTPSQTASTSSKETLISSSSSHSIQSSQTPESDIRSRWDRWGLSRGKRDRTPSKSNAPEIQKADFPPVFHITLKDHVLLEGNPVTLSCLPAGSPEPNILWIKDKKPLEINDRMSLVACPDGRQLLMIMKTSKKDAGIYECVASNNLASATSSCILSIACVPKRPGTPEIPQIYNNTALVQWKPSDSKVPCTYTLEKKCDGDDKWVTEATGVTDCFYNSSVFPTGSTIQFRVACVNKAGQGPYSNVSKGVRINVEVPPLCQPAEMKIHPSSPFSVAAVTTSASTLAEPSMSIPPLVHPKPTSTINIVTPVTQTQTVSARSYTAPPSIGRSISPVPSHVPATCSVAPTPISPPVILVKSISPIGEGASSPPQKTPMERVVSTTKTETTLKQGVPQKPYSFFDEKARGRFGVIRDCRENSTGKMFIAKIIPYDQQAKQAVIKEYEILKSLRCERIMALHEAYITPRYLVLITEYCTGKEILYSLIERFCYSEDDVVGFIVQILQGLEYLHNCRILHLDIKPDNIMVTNLNVIKIIDFGSAQRFNPLSLKQYSRELGTLEYMAPELLKGDLVGPPADIWSLGVLSYIMLSGRLPFQDKDPKLTETKIHAAKFDSTKLYPKVSQSASTFLKKTLNGYPWCRPTIKDCLNHSWLHDSYLKKLRRQTLTFTTTRLKEFLEEHQRRCAESATKHQVLLRVYQSGSSSPASPTKSSSPSTPISEEKH
uniref:non-specific serine/threonine protein kinase n=1 Tax=Cyprinus carpio TaxID=7962 RepID=A0A8C1IND1_CYPCA